MFQLNNFLTFTLHFYNPTNYSKTSLKAVKVSQSVKLFACNFSSQFYRNIVPYPAEKQ